jgi:hypothetical protein
MSYGDVEHMAGIVLIFLVSLLHQSMKMFLLKGKENWRRASELMP